MNTRNIQLNGSNLCNTECLDRNAILHPETCVNQILTTDNSISTLSDWVDGDDDGETHHGSFADYNNLKAWLDANLSSSLSTASETTKGAVKIGNYLSMSGEVLSVDKSSLNIPDEVGIASISNEGSIKLGNKTEFTSDISNYDTTITSQTQDSWGYNGHVYVFPLRLDSKSRAGIGIPTGLFNTSSGQALDWTLDWSKKVISVDASSTTGGTETNYILLGNKSNSTANGELGYDDNGDLSVDYGYPRLALVAGENITFKRFNNKFIQNVDNFWGDTITEVLISSDIEAPQYIAGEGIDITADTISQEVAASSTVGGIKIGYTENGELKPVLLDEGNKAYVNISNGSLKNHEVTAINQVAYDQYSNYFDTYTVRCNISNENLTVVNINDFKQIGGGYNTIQNINVEDTYEWDISTAGANNNIAIIHAISVAAKGCFQLTIDHNKNDNHIIETHNVGFVIDTPSNYTFAWFSTCNWNISLYTGGDVGSTALRVYLKVPSDFQGTVKISGIHLVTASGDNVGSMNGTTYKRWDAHSPFINGSVTDIEGNQISGTFKYKADAFVTLSNSPSIGDFLYDSEINDTLIHNLLTRVKAIELWMQSQQQ